jgi:hypothetical protein
MTQPRRSRKRTPVLLTGSSISRGTIPAPQQKPANSGKFDGPVTELQAVKIDKSFTDHRAKFHELFNTPAPPPEKELTIDDVAPVALPKCPHGRRLTKGEWIFECAYKRKFHTPKSPPKSFECILCHPVCIHGLELTQKEITTSKRFSGTCPVCADKIVSPKRLEEFLSKQKLSLGYGMSFIEDELVTSYGLAITKAGKMYSRIGGTVEMERQDAKNEVFDPGTPGHGSDTYEDEQDYVNDLNEPISAKSSFIAKSEHIRSAEITDTVKASLIDHKTEIKESPALAKPENEAETPVETVIPDCEPPSEEFAPQRVNRR